MQQLEHTQPAVTPGCKERPQPPLSHGSQITGLTGASAGSCWIQGVPWCAAAGRKPAWWVARLYTSQILCSGQPVAQLGAELGTFAFPLIGLSAVYALT